MLVFKCTLPTLPPPTQPSPSPLETAGVTTVTTLFPGSCLMFSPPMGLMQELRLTLRLKWILYYSLYDMLCVCCEIGWNMGWFSTKNYGYRWEKYSLCSRNEYNKFWSVVSLLERTFIGFLATLLMWFLELKRSYPRKPAQNDFITTATKQLTPAFSVKKFIDDIFVHLSTCYWNAWMIVWLWNRQFFGLLAEETTNKW